MPSVLAEVLIWILQVFLLILLVRVIMSWVFQLSQYRATGAVAAMLEVVYTVTDPPLKLLARVLPPLRIGNASLDVGTLILFLGGYALVSVLAQYR